MLYAPPPGLRYIAALLMLPAFSLALASVIPGRIRTAAQHPPLLATMLWALAHLLTNGSVADLLLFGTFLVWAVAVRISLERRPARPIRVLPGSPANNVTRFDDAAQMGSNREVMHGAGDALPGYSSVELVIPVVIPWPA